MAKKKAKAVPRGHRTVTPYLTVKGGRKALAWYRKAFGARVVYLMPGPAGTVAHAEIRIGDSLVMLSDEFPNAGPQSPKSLGGTTGNLHLYVKDCDAVYRRARKAGARIVAPMADMFWGDRWGLVRDPFGHLWGISTHVEDVTPRESARRMEAMMAKS